MAIFSFLARLGLDTTQFQAGVKRAERSASGMANNLGSVFSRVGGRLAGLFTVAAAAQVVRSLNQRANAIADLADSLGVTTDEAQKMEMAAAHSTVSMDALSAALAKVAKFQAELAEGSEQAITLSERLGIASREALPLSAQDLFLKATENVNLGLASQAALFELVGKKGRDLQRFAEEYKKTGGMEIMSEESIREWERMSDELGAFWNRVKSGYAEPLAPVAGLIADAFKDSRERRAKGEGLIATNPVGVLGKNILDPIGQSVLDSIGAGGTLANPGERRDLSSGGVDLSPLSVASAIKEREYQRRLRMTESDKTVEALLKEISNSGKMTVEKLSKIIREQQ